MNATGGKMGNKTATKAKNKTGTKAKRVSLDGDVLKAAGLGTVADEVLATKFKVSKQAIHQWRQRLGIAAANPMISRARDLEKKIAEAVDNGAIGGVTIAEQLGVSASVVSSRARAAGIKIARKSPEPLRSKEEVAAVLKPGRTIKEAAKALGLPHYNTLYRYIHYYGLESMWESLRDGRRVE